jgi:hypothetical protein
MPVPATGESLSMPLLICCLPRSTAAVVLRWTQQANQIPPPTVSHYETIKFGGGHEDQAQAN